MGVIESKECTVPDYNFYDDYLRKCTAAWHELCKLNEYLKSNQELYKQVQGFEFVQNARLLRKTMLHNFSRDLQDYLKPSSTPAQRLQVETEIKNSWRTIRKMLQDLAVDYKAHLPDLDKYINIPVHGQNQNNSDPSSSSSCSESPYEIMYSRMTWGKDPELLFLLITPFWSNRYIMRYILEAVKDQDGRMGCLILSPTTKLTNTVTFESISADKRMRLGLPNKPKLYLALFNFFGRPANANENQENEYYDYGQIERIAKCKKDGCIHPFHWRPKVSSKGMAAATASATAASSTGGGKFRKFSPHGNTSSETVMATEFNNDLLDLDNRLEMISSLKK